MEEKLALLTPEQEQFVRNYTSQGELYSNGVLSYASAYGYTLKIREDGKYDYTDPNYATCNACAHRLLQKDYIKKRIQEIYLALWNDEAVDARTAEIIYKGQESNSVQAVKIFNDLKQRITKKLDITSAGRPLAGLSDEELEKITE
jgi:hypothetical protein